MECSSPLGVAAFLSSSRASGGHLPGAARAASRRECLCLRRHRYGRCLTSADHGGGEGLIPLSLTGSAIASSLYPTPPCCYGPALRHGRAAHRQAGAGRAQVPEAGAARIVGSARRLVLSFLLAWRTKSVWAPVRRTLAWQTFVLVAALRAAGMRLRFQWNAYEVRAMLRYGVSMTTSMRVWQLRTLVNPVSWAASQAPKLSHSLGSRFVSPTR